MSSVVIGLVAGLIFGCIDILLMIPLDMPNKKVAMLGAFTNRFAIGFLIANTSLPLPYWVSGMIIGLLISIPDAIITKAYAPILGVGVSGGAALGFIIEKWFL